MSKSRVDVYERRHNARRRLGKVYDHPQPRPGRGKVLPVEPFAVGARVIFSEAGGRNGSKNDIDLVQQEITAPVKEVELGTAVEHDLAAVWI